MAKIALITDLHFGVRGDNVAFLDMTKKFLDDVFFPTLKKENIDTVIHLGDLLDKRKSTNNYTAHRLDEDFIQPMLSRNINFLHIIGNHDCYYKNTNKVNSVKNLYDNTFPIFEDAQDVEVHGLSILFVPWIPTDEQEKQKTYDRIKSSTSKVCMGHLELRGFEMHKGSIVSHGDSSEIFTSKFDLTLSGHYHHRSSVNNLHYLGSHGQFTWSDYGDERGFHILDTETLALTFIENPYKMFTKVFYDDTDKTMEEIMAVDFSEQTGTFVKVVVQNKNNPFWFDSFCEKLEKSNPLDTKIVEDHLNMDIEDNSDIINEAETTLDIFKKTIQTLDPETVDLFKLDSMITNLYSEAMALG